jgi:hypothetical protein
MWFWPYIAFRNENSLHWVVLHTYNNIKWTLQCSSHVSHTTNQTGLYDWSDAVQMHTRRKGWGCASQAPASKLTAQYRKLIDKTFKTVFNNISTRCQTCLRVYPGLDLYKNT